MNDLCNATKTSLISNTKYIEKSNNIYNTKTKEIPVYPNTENDYVLITNPKSLHPTQIQNYLGKTTQIIENDPIIKKDQIIKLKNIDQDLINSKINKTQKNKTTCRTCTM